jgi:hypothetical protein
MKYIFRTFGFLAAIGTQSLYASAMTEQDILEALANGVPPSFLVDAGVPEDIINAFQGYEPGVQDIHENERTIKGLSKAAVEYLQTLPMEEIANIEIDILRLTFPPVPNEPLTDITIEIQAHQTPTMQTNDDNIGRTPVSQRALNYAKVHGQTEESLTEGMRLYPLSLGENPIWLKVNTNIVAVRSLLNEQDTERVRTLYDTAHPYDDTDVHTFNKRWSKANISTILAIYSHHYGTPEVMDLNTLEAMIYSVSGSNELINAINQLRHHGGDFRDNESGVESTLQMLSWNWSLASQMDREFTFQFQGIQMHGTAQEFIVQSFLENARTQGGCAPGYAGRFVRDMLILLSVQAGI